MAQKELTSPRKLFIMQQDQSQNGCPVLNILGKEVVTMKSYTLKKISGTPDWDAIAALQIDVPYQEPADIQAWAKLCWDETGIHVNLQTKEKNIRCQELQPLDPICEDSCLEFFIRPTEAMQYFNFEYNLACNIYLGFGSCIDDSIRLVPNDQKALFHPRSYRTEDGWGITYHIPFTFIQLFFPGFQAQEGLQFYGNCYKCGDKTVQPHYLSWNPIQPGVLSFHCPAFFGRMILGGE